MTMNEGAEIYAPHGQLLQAGGRLEQPGLAGVLDELASDPATFYRGSLAKELLALSSERGGLLTAADLAAYEPRWHDPVEVAYRTWRVTTRGGLSGMPETIPRLPLCKASTRPSECWRSSTSSPAPSRRTVTRRTLPSSTATERVRRHVEPRSRLGRLPARPRSAPEQHARRGRPAARELRRLEDAEHDGALTGIRRSWPCACRWRGGWHSPAHRSARRCREHPRRGPVGRGRRRTAAVHPARVSFMPSPASTPRRSTSSRPAAAGSAWPAPHHYFGGVSVVSRAGAAADPRRSGAATVFR